MVTQTHVYAHMHTQNIQALAAMPSSFLRVKFPVPQTHPVTVYFFLHLCIGSTVHTHTHAQYSYTYTHACAHTNVNTMHTCVCMSTHLSCSEISAHRQSVSVNKFLQGIQCSTHYTHTELMRVMARMPCTIPELYILFHVISELYLEALYLAIGS